MQTELDHRAVAEGVTAAVVARKIGCTSPQLSLWRRAAGPIPDRVGFALKNSSG
jgi:hypothetical protein